MTTLRILHAATHGHNIGDGALVAGLHRVLAEDLGVTLDVTPLDVLDAKLGGRRDMLPRGEARRLAERFDLVLVGGGGMIEGGKGNFLSGINFNFHLAAIAESGLPWVFYALGFNQFRRTFFFHRRRLGRLVEIAAAGEHPFSLRNDGSEARLARLLGGSPPVETVPDPGLWVPPGAGHVPEASPERPNLLVQLAGDRSRRRFGLGRRRLLRSLAATLASLAEERGVHLILAPHLLVDLPLYAELVAALPGRVVRRSCTLSPVLVGSAGAPDFFDRYRRADLVIGMRGHSVICAVGTGTPVLGLASHDKVGGFLADVGLADWTVDLDEGNASTELASRVRELLDDLPAARRRVAAALPPLRQRARAFHRRIAARLGL